MTTDAAPSGHHQRVAKLRRATQLMAYLAGTVLLIFEICTYACVIRQGLLDRTSAMPFLALAMNITWEFLVTFIYPSVGGLMQEIINLTWFAADIIILAIFLKYWRSDYPKSLPESYFWPIFVFTLP